MVVGSFVSNILILCELIGSTVSILIMYELIIIYSFYRFIFPSLLYYKCPSVKYKWISIVILVFGIILMLITIPFILFNFSYILTF